MLSMLHAFQLRFTVHRFIKHKPSRHWLDTPLPVGDKSYRSPSVKLHLLEMPWSVCVGVVFVSGGIGCHKQESPCGLRDFGQRAV